jgi:glycosyltransferase involved in cell wall biosynthesis
MRILSICVVRDEHDIIQETITCALEWSDRIFVLDNGSTDGTWEQLQEFAARNSEISLVGRELGAFRDELRGEVYSMCRHEADPGDWWCWLDADEFYIDDPRTFLKRIPPRFGFVRSATFNYYFTDRDLAAYERDPESWLRRPVQDRLRYYENNWSEGRFVRHRADLRWAGKIWPPNRGRIHRRRIRLKHFQYRSPEQIARRLEIRQPQFNIFRHESAVALAVPTADADYRWVRDWLRHLSKGKATWRDRIREAALCQYDAGDGLLVLREDLMPRLPPRLLDIARASLQASQFGTLVLQPYTAWRRRRS